MAALLLMPRMNGSSVAYRIRSGQCNLCIRRALRHQAKPERQGPRRLSPVALVLVAGEGMDAGSVSNQLLDGEGFDVITHDAGVPLAMTAGALKDDDSARRQGGLVSVGNAPGEQRPIPAAPDMRAVDDVIRQHDHASGLKKGKGVDD